VTSGRTREPARPGKGTLSSLQAVDIGQSGAAQAIRAALRRAGIEISRYPAATTLEGHLRQLLRALAIGCVLDVGAHRGEYGTLLRRIGYQGRIVSFEPNPAEHEIVARVASSDSRWEARQVALGSDTRSRLLNVAASTDLASFLQPSERGEQYFAEAISKRENVMVEVSTLADVLSELELTEPVFLKTDTQGFDLEVLRGASDRLGDLAGVQAELALVPAYDQAPRYLEVLDYMEKYGFEVTGFFPVLRDLQRLTLLEVDCIWRRPR